MDSFDKDFDKHVKNMKIAGIIVAILGLGFVGFIIWVIIKLLQHWSVI